MKKYFVVKYTGPFGFIKPWTAVRDIETFSQQFLTPSIVEGIEKKLFPELLSTRGQIFKIKRHRLSYQSIDVQQEKTWPKSGIVRDRKGVCKTKTSIIQRGFLINPFLYLAFEEEKDAFEAAKQHICLCRNEDVLLPHEVFCTSQEKFDEIDGFELIFTDAENGFKVGHNRFRLVDGKFGEEMFGDLQIFGNPVRNQ
jgi:hypothetical protein